MAYADDERRARATLTRLGQPGDAQLGMLVRTKGAVAAVATIRVSSSSTSSHGSKDIAVPRQALERWRAQLEKVDGRDDLVRLRERGIRLLCPSDPQWPTQLGDLGDTQPLALWLRGEEDLSALCQRSVAIVGSRAASYWGVVTATDFAASLADQGWTIISGGAFGVDAAAHQGALGVSGLSAAVLAGGVDVPYPAKHAGLLNNLAVRGVVVSEAAPGVRPTRWRFVARNRITSALAGGTLVVEAVRRSGTMHTAGFAHDLGRPLMVASAPDTSDLSPGCQEILDELQGTLVSTAAKVVDLITAARPASTTLHN